MIVAGRCWSSSPWTHHSRSSPSRLQLPEEVLQLLPLDVSISWRETQVLLATSQPDHPFSAVGSQGFMSENASCRWGQSSFNRKFGKLRYITSSVDMNLCNSRNNGLIHQLFYYLKLNYIHLQSTKSVKMTIFSLLVIILNWIKSYFLDPYLTGP